MKEMDPLDRTIVEAVLANAKPDDVARITGMALLEMSRRRMDRSRFRQVFEATFWTGIFIDRLED